jgi:prevent-host-death family protein
MVPSLKFSQARNDLSRVVDRVQAGEPAVIERRGVRFLVTSLDEQRELLAGAFAFHPEVLSDGPGVGIVLPELSIHGEGDTLEEAEEDLVGAAIDYAGDWHDLLHTAPNHADRRGWVWRITLAEDRDAVRRIIFGR